jgi:hypothetical protein
MDIKVLFGKPKTYKIGGEEFTFHPLDIGDADLFVSTTKGSEGETMKKIIKATFKKSYPEVTDEDVEKISFAYMKELSEAIADVNNLPVPE